MPRVSVLPVGTFSLRHAVAITLLWALALTLLLAWWTAFSALGTGDHPASAGQKESIGSRLCFQPRPFGSGLLRREVSCG